MSNFTKTGLYRCGNELSLVIEDVENGGFKARFTGQSFDVECGVGKGLAMAVRSEVPVITKEPFYDINEFTY